MSKYVIIGISDSDHFVLSDEVKALLPLHKIFSGGSRHKERIAQYLPPAHTWVNINKDIPSLLQQYQAFSKPVVIFASGDPLFYGLANSILKYTPAADVKVYPYFNSLQLLCQRCNIAYAGIRNTSVHGRSYAELDSALIQREPLIGVLTDGVKTPAAIARRLLQYGFTNYQLIVGEALEGVEEKIGTYSLQQAANGQFHSLNCVLLQQTALKHKWLGIPDYLFKGLPDRPNMITKMPIRLLSLSKLDLYNKSVCWDIGFCTGAVAIEARNQFPLLEVIAFEKRPECAALLDENSQQLGVPGITKVMGDFFEQDLQTYPSPDAIFIGGHGNRLGPLMQLINGYLTKGGRVVINAVKGESKAQFEQSCGVLGLQLQPPVEITIDNHNTITVLTAEKIYT